MYSNIMKCGIVLLLTATLFSCTGNKPGDDYRRKVTLKPHDTAVQGYLEKAFQVVNTTANLDYKADNYVSEGTVMVRIRSIGSGDNQDYGLRDGHKGPLYLTLCDSTGKPIRGFDDFASDAAGDAMLKNLLANKGATHNIPFYFFLDKGKKLPDGVKTFIIHSKKQEKEYIRDTAEWHRPDWDEIIDQFEQQVDAYRESVKEARRGDTVAITQHPEHLKVVRGTEEVLVRARFDHELSDRQIRRVIKIQDQLLDVEKDRLKLKGN
jgi:hypothetical protein